MKKKAFYIALAVIFFIILTLIIANQVASRTKPYVNGDAINYQGQIIFGSTNMDGVEIFRLENNEIIRTAKFKSYDAYYGGWDDFNDIAFNIENGALFMYLTDGRYLYKFDICDPAHPKLVKQLKDNAYDWFKGVGRTDNHIYTIGTKGIKIWNSDMEVINTHPIISDNAHQIKVSRDENFIFDIKKDWVKVFDANLRQHVSSLELVISEDHPRNVYLDQTDGLVYLVDDTSLRQFDLDGNLLNSFRHISTLGYDADGLDDENYLYFSDGIGIVKNSKSDLKPIDWVYTTDLGGSGGWAMAMKVVPDYGGEKIIVFNNSNILVLDQNLNKIDSFAASDEQVKPFEDLSLTFDRNWGYPGTDIMLSGKGFGLNEELVVNFAKQKFYASSDDNGAFSITITVPELGPGMKPGIYDIKVDGLKSNRTYSITFRILE